MKWDWMPGNGIVRMGYAAEARTLFVDRAELGIRAFHHVGAESFEAFRARCLAGEDIYPDLKRRYINEEAEEVWVSGRSICETTSGAVWDLQGIYSTHDRAVRACIDKTYFVGPIMKDFPLPHETREWDGCYYPLSKAPEDEDVKVDLDLLAGLRASGMHLSPEWQDVKSSSLLSIRYGGRSKFLDVQFKRGEIYRYIDVEAAVVDALLAAESIGAYFVKNIRNKYPYVVLDALDADKPIPSGDPQ